jgi:hypothetical protein
MVTELRVHGVSGASAGSMLDRPLLHQVAGDHEAGFWRPRPEYGNTTGPGGALLEAYRWGNLTAGAAARALWLLLSPFMLANVVIWLRPPAGPRAAVITRALCRVFGLSITGTFVLSIVGVSMDLVAWQCAGPGNPCAAGRSWLAFLTAGFFAPPGRRLAVLALVPVLAVALLWWLARTTWARYERYPLSERTDGDGLAAAGFWAGGALVGRLRSIHVAFGLGTVTAVLAAVLAAHDRARPGLLAVGGVALTLATGVLLAACLVAVCLPGMVSRDRPARWAEGAARGVRIAALVLLALTLGYALAGRGPWVTTGGLPGYGSAVTILFAAQIVLLAALGVVVVAGRGGRGAMLGGLAAPVLASIALGMAAAFTAGLSYRVADFLDRGDVPSSAGAAGSGGASPAAGAQPALEPPAAYEWTAFGAVLMLVAVAAVVLVARWRLRPRLRAQAGAVTDADFPGDRARDPARASAIDEAIADARLTEHLEPLLMWAYVPLAVAAVVVTGFALAGVGPVDLADSGTRAATVLSFLTNLGTYVIGLAALGLIVVGLLAYRYLGIRRIVGVLWDLGTFWPRLGHPLAPPCYAERVVPELVTRASRLAEADGVVLSGHSQGSVLVAAAVLQMPPRARAGVALVTYGSPLGRLYARLFPAYVNPAVLAAVADAVGGRWRNLWRDTDPIGGPVDGADNVRLRDPVAFDVQSGDTVPPRIHGHSGYQGHPAFAEAVTDLVRRLSA